MAHSVRRFAVVGCVAVLAALGLVSVVAANSYDCVSRISGTYFRPADFVLTLDRDGSLVGHYSRTTQDFIGLGESFSGSWTCRGSGVAIQQFHFLESGGNRLVERGNATGTYSSATKTLTLTYTFHVFDENASAADLRSANGTVVNVPPLQATRVSTP